MKILSGQLNCSVNLPSSQTVKLSQKNLCFYTDTTIEKDVTSLLMVICDNEVTFSFIYFFVLDKDSEDVKNYLRSLSEGSLVQLGCVLGLSYSRIRAMKLFPGKSMTVIFKSKKLCASLVSR